MNLISFYTSANQFQQYYRLKSANFLYQSNVNLLMERISLATVKDKDAVIFLLYADHSFWEFCGETDLMRIISNQDRNEID